MTKLIKLGEALLSWLARPMFRRVVWLGLLILLGGLLYVWVVQPLKGELTLPAGVLPETPVIDQSILESIENRSLERIHRAPIDWSAFSGHFVQPG